MPRPRTPRLSVTVSLEGRKASRGAAPETERAADPALDPRASEEGGETRKKQGGLRR